MVGYSKSNGFRSSGLKIGYLSSARGGRSNKEVILGDVTVSRVKKRRYLGSIIQVNKISARTSFIV